MIDRLVDCFALHFVPEGYSVAGQKLMGRQAAGAGLMRAIARCDELAAIGAFSASAAHAKECESMLKKQGYRGTVDWVSLAEPQALAPFGCLYHPAPGIQRLAWRRLPLGDRSYSLCGITHTTASHAIMSSIAELLVAPVRSWDAVICTSRVVRDSVRQLLEQQADYLRARLGAQRFELPQLPLIPLGVHCDDLQFDAQRRIQARNELQIGADDVAFLFLGRLSFHAKAHPQQMFRALERAEKKGRAVHLILCGWFANEAIEKAFREAAALLCPSIRLTILDGRMPQQQSNAWAAADVFTSLSDNIQETFGLTPAEAMAAGLPCVVSDWNGYRDTVRDGVDGFRIPTVMPEAGAGIDLAQRYDDGIDSYDMYCGHTSQAVAVDGALLADAYSRLICDAGLRKSLGENARRRARREFDWNVIFQRYRTLWYELDERRRGDAELLPAPPARIPDRPDPFGLFRSYPSSVLAGQVRVALAPEATLMLIEQYRKLGINRFAQASLPTLAEFEKMLGRMEKGEVAVNDIVSLFAPQEKARILRGLAWLCKMDLLRMTPAADVLN
jgi:alpha-maltose-1-phosphate synthase